MKEVVCCYLLVCAEAIGSTETECIAAERRNLICIFPFNINSTHKDFGVYFYPDDGGEEPLVDCAWLKSELRCIKQKDFKCKQPVSEIAEITIPERFWDKNGSYRCVPEGHRHDTVKSCRLPDNTDRNLSTVCDLKTTSDVHLVTVRCSFSLPVDRFTVEQGATLVGSFTKHDCKNSTVCGYSVQDKHDIFTMMLDLSQNPYGDYSCHADHLSLHPNITGCSLSSNESSPVPVYAVVIPLAIVFIVIAAAIGIRCKQKRRTKEEKRVKKRKKLDDLDKSLIFKSSKGAKEISTGICKN